MLSSDLRLSRRWPRSSEVESYSIRDLEHLRRFALPLGVRRALDYSWYLSDSGQGWQTSRAGRHGILAALTSQLPSAIGNPW